MDLSNLHVSSTEKYFDSTKITTLTRTQSEQLKFESIQGAGAELEGRR